MKRREFLKTMAVGPPAMAMPRLARGAEQTGWRPNVLFIMTDQQFAELLPDKDARGTTSRLTPR